MNCATGVSKIPCIVLQDLIYCSDTTRSCRPTIAVHLWLRKPFISQKGYSLDSMFLWMPSFFRLKLHCGAIAERRLDCKGLIIFLFCKFPWYEITHMWQWLQRRFCNLVSITLKFVTGSRNNYWSYCYQSESRSAFGNISLGIISISRLAHFFFFLLIYYSL